MGSSFSAIKLKDDNFTEKGHWNGCFISVILRINFRIVILYQNNKQLLLRFSIHWNQLVILTQNVQYVFSVMKESIALN